MSNEVGDAHGQVVQAGHVDRIDVHPAQVPVTALSGLPPATAVFCGRQAELAALRACWSAEGPAVVSSSVAGLAGIGKTELVLHAAHRAVEDGEFPGGVLFVDLQGYDEARRVAPAQALDGFLRALGVDSHQIPPTEDQRAVLYRSVLHSRPRMLVVLDNTASTAQIRPLLPGSRHAVVITSRHTLSGLDEAHPLGSAGHPRPPRRAQLTRAAAPYAPRPNCSGKFLQRFARYALGCYERGTPAHKETTWFPRFHAPFSWCC